MKPLVSIIVPTYKRKINLLTLLSSLAKNIDWRATELIIVEQGENNKNAFNGIVPFSYIFLRGRSITHSLNEAVRMAKGMYVLLLDDELTVSNNLIKSHLKNFTDKTVGVTVGRIITDGQAIEKTHAHTARVDWLGRVSGGYSSLIRQEIDSAIAVNSCWRKEIFKEIGRFDERFAGNAMRFETDASLRAKKLGYKIIFEPNALVYHHQAVTGGTRKSEGRIQWYFDFFSNETYFFLKHKPHMLLPIFLLTITGWALRCMFGFGREVSIRSLITPARGIISGIKKYYDYRC